MKNKGYVALHRKIIDSPIFDNPKGLKVWLWCLCKANHKNNKVLIGTNLVEVKKGQFIFGRKKASVELGMTESTTYRLIKLLEKLEMISIDSNNKYSILTINNWNTYQGQQMNKEEMKKNNNKRRTNKQQHTMNISIKEEEKNNKETSSEQQKNTNNNVKNVNNDLKKNKEKKSFNELEEIINDFTNNEEVKEGIKEFINYRKNMKKQVTPLALRKIVDKFKKWNYEDVEIIECLSNSIINGWIGIFELKRNKTKQGQNIKYKFTDYNQRSDINFDEIEKSLMKRRNNNVENIDIKKRIEEMRGKVV